MDTTWNRASGDPPTKVEFLQELRCLCHWRVCHNKPDYSGFDTSVWHPATWQPTAVKAIKSPTATAQLQIEQSNGLLHGTCHILM